MCHFCRTILYWSIWASVPSPPVKKLKSSSIVGMLHLSIATSCTCSVVQSLKSLAQFTQCVIHTHFAFTSAHCFLLKRFDVHTYSSIKILWYKTESKINTGENSAKLIGYNLWAKKSGRPFIHWASHLDPSAPTRPLLYKAIYCKAFKHRDHFYWTMLPRTISQRVSRSHHSRSINNAVAGQGYNYLQL